MVLLPSNLGFLFLSRCLIFKVQSLSSLEDSSTSISHILAVVNTFLKVFSKNFLTLFACLGCCRGKLANNITSFSLCQQFFETFFKFFQNLRCFCTLIRVHLMFFTKSGTIYWVTSPFTYDKSIYRYKKEIPPKEYPHKKIVY